MQKKLFLSSFFIILITILLSMLSVYMVFQKHFGNYLTETAENSLEQIPSTLSHIYEAYDGWDPRALHSFAHSLPFGTEITLKSPSGDTLLTLTNPMQSMHHHHGGNMGMRGGMGMGMGAQMGNRMGMNMNMGRNSNINGNDINGNYTGVEWKTRTLNVNTPEGTIATATIRYPDRAQFLNPEDISFISAFLKSFLYAGLGALVIGIILSYWLNRRLVSPLQSLTKAVGCVGKGYLDQQVPIATKDEVGQLAAAFNKMTENLKQQEYLRKQFSADIAHELRTPLTSIRSYIEAFQDGVLPPTKENLNIINEEIERLTNLASDLKDLSIADMGNLKTNFTSIDLGQLIDKTIFKLYPLLQEKEININWQTPTPPVIIPGDEHLLTRLFYNLIHNAYKYSENQSNIKIHLENRTNDCLVTITDTGIGIPEEDLPYIFERFYRAEKSRARVTGGTGIGLSLAKEITELHKGEIMVESKQGQGSKFTIIFPKKN